MVDKSEGRYTESPYHGYTRIAQDETELVTSQAGEPLADFARRQQALSRLVSQQRAVSPVQFTEGAPCCQLWWEGYYTIMPENNCLVDCWDVVVIIALFATALFMPFEAAFLRPHGQPPQEFVLIGRAIDCIFMADIIFTFNVAYAEPNPTAVSSTELWVRRPAQVAAQYMAFPCSQKMTAGWFWPDMITIIPWDKLTTTDARDVRLVRVLRLVRMLRLVRVLKLFKRWHTHSGFSFSMVRIFTCACTTLMLVHWLACIWGHLGMNPAWYTGNTSVSWLSLHMGESGRDAELLTDWDVYRVSLYLCTVVLCTVGFGDIVPTNDIEIMMMIGTIFITGITWAWVVANVVSVLTSFDKFGSHFNHTMDDINELMGTQKLPKFLTHRIRRHMHESYHVQRRLHHRDALSWLSEGLKGELAIESGVDKVCNCIWYFRDLPQPVLTELADKFRGSLFSPNEMIMDNHSLMVVVRGTCIKRTRILGRDSVFGEDMILASDFLRDTSCPRTMSYVEVMSLHKDALRDTCIKFPYFDKRIRRAQIKLAVWRAFIQQAEMVKREKERTSTDKKSMWDQGYFMADNLMDRQPGDLGRLPGRPATGSRRASSKDSAARQPRRPPTGSGPGPTKTATVWGASKSAPTSPTNGLDLAVLSPANSAKAFEHVAKRPTWTTSGSLRDTPDTVMAELQKMHALLSQVQVESRERWEELDGRFACVERKVDALGKRKFWG